MPAPPRGASIHTDPDHGARRHRGVAPGVRFPLPRPESSRPPSDSICAFEEEANIGDVLAAMPAEACGVGVTTLVVVDGGTDRTDEIAKDSGAVTFVLSQNLGHGYALRVGYALCIELGAQYVVTLDADGQNDPAEIPVMLQPLVDDEADFVVASLCSGRDTTTDRFRKAGVRVFSAVMSAMGRTKLTDTSNGYRALRVSMLDDIAYRLVQTQYQTAELLIIAMQRGPARHRAPDPVAPACARHDQEGQELALRVPLRARRARDMVEGAQGAAPLLIAAG